MEQAYLNGKTELELIPQGTVSLNMNALGASLPLIRMHSSQRRCDAVRSEYLLFTPSQACIPCMVTENYQ